MIIIEYNDKDFCLLITRKTTKKILVVKWFALKSVFIY